MTSEYEHLSYDQQIEAKLTTSLSTESAIEWLKANASKKGSSMLSSNTNNLKDFVNSSYVKRDDPNLSLAVARYGTHIETLKKLYQSDDPVIKMAILANSSIGPEGFLKDGIIEESEAIKLIVDPEVNSDFIKALFSNPHIDREFLTEVVEKKKEFKDIDDNTFLLIIWTIISNPILVEKYDDTIMDGYAQYRFEKLLFSLFSLVSTVPVNNNWASILQPLLFKITLPFNPDDPSLNVTNRWFNPETEDDKGELSDMEKDAFFFLRKEIAKVFLKSNYEKNREKLSPSHQDKAIRLAYYENTKPTDFFDWGIENEDFEYPSFEYLDSYDLSETQEKVVSTCKKYFALDKEDFVDSLINNLSFWKRKQERELLSDLSWRLPNNDPFMDHPNHYRIQESHMLSEHPHFFDDDEFADPEEFSLKNEVEKINEKLEKIYSHQEIQFKNLEEEQRNEFSSIRTHISQRLEDIRRGLSIEIQQNSDKGIITHLIDRIKMIERKSLSTAWMWLIIFLLILILLTKH